jgi:hypothetical protein
VQVFFTHESIAVTVELPDPPMAPKPRDDPLVLRRKNLS